MVFCLLQSPTNIRICNTIRRSKESDFLAITFSIIAFVFSISSTTLFFYKNQKNENDYMNDCQQDDHQKLFFLKFQDAFHVFTNTEKVAFALNFLKFLKLVV